jgi:DinB superfamily
MALDWNRFLREQLTWHWDNQLRPKIDSLTDDEYFWEPVDGCWSVRRRGTSGAPMAVGSGHYVIEFALLEPDPPPVTTIAWRLGHIIVGVFGARNATHFGGPPVSYEDFPYAGSARDALRQLDEAYAAWVAGVRGLGEDGLARACGPAEGPYAENPLAALVLHINREALHHGAEVLLLRDLYRNRSRA